MKKFRIIFAIIVLSLVVLVFLVKSEKPKNEARTVVRVAYNATSANYGVAMVLKDKMFYKNDNFDLELMPLKSATEVRQAIATGQANMGFLSATRAFAAMAAGAPMKFIAPSSVSSIMIFVRNDDEINSLKDLENKKVSGGSGGSSELVFRRAVLKEGLDISKIEFIEIDDQYEPIALTKNMVIDAIPGSLYNSEMTNNFDIKILPEWIEKGYDKEYFPITMIVVNTDFLNENPEINQQIIESIVKTQDFMSVNQEESAQIIASHINANSVGVANFTSEEILGTWEKGLKYSLWLDPDILLEMSKLSYDLGIIEKNLSLEDIYDLRFEELLENANKQIYKTE